MREGPRSNRASFYGPVAPLGARRIAVASLIAVWLAFTFPLFAGKVHFPTDFAGPRPVSARGDPPSNPDDGDDTHREIAMLVTWAATRSARRQP